MAAASLPMVKIILSICLAHMLLLCTSSPVGAFVVVDSSINASRRGTVGFFPSRSLMTALSESSSSSSDESNTFLEALKARQIELDIEQCLLDQKWRDAECESEFRVALPEWVRRIDVDFPLVACGSSKGHIYISNLETGELISTNDDGTAPNMDDDSEDDDESKPDNIARVLQFMFGLHDGGGTLAIAFAGDLACIANREGSVQIWRIDRSDASRTKPLISQGTIVALEGTIVTKLHLDDEYLWVATSTGKVQAFMLDGIGDALPLAMRQAPDMEWDFSEGIILSLSVHPDIGCGVITTEDGRVEVFSLEESGKKLGTFVPPFDSAARRSSNAYATSAIVAPYKKQSNAGIDDDDDDYHDVDGDDDDDDDDSSTSDIPLSYAIICGGNDGSLWMQNLHVDEDGDIDEEKPFDDLLEPLMPPHLGAVKCMASPRTGLLLTGGLDSSIRLTDLASGESLYRFHGFRVWLGSLWTDGQRLLSDGCDNKIMMHDFSIDSDKL